MPPRNKKTPANTKGGPKDGHTYIKKEPRQEPDLLACSASAPKKDMKAKATSVPTQYPHFDPMELSRRQIKKAEPRQETNLLSRTCKQAEPKNGTGNKVRTLKEIMAETEEENKNAITVKKEDEDENNDYDDVGPGWEFFEYDIINGVGTPRLL